MNPHRRLIIAAAGALLSLAPRIQAQQAKTYRIGWLAHGRTMVGSRALDAFRSGLRDLGYVDGRNLNIIERWSDASMEDSDRLAVELVQLEPDLLVTTSAAILSAVKAGARMPVVFAFSGDPVVANLVESLAKPGRNLTGMSFLSLELAGKRMELLKEVLPGLKRVAVFANPQHPGKNAEFATAQDAARKLGYSIDYFELRTLAELNTAFQEIPKLRCEAIMVFPDARMMSFSDELAAFSAKAKIPTISGWTHFAERGNLMTYGPQFEQSFRHLATYVDKVFKGAKPGDLPVELPTKFELILNMKTARAIGIKMPNSIMVRADKVIQ